MMRNLCTLLACAATALAQVGIVDTVGGTTYDWQWNGPALRRLVRDPLGGLHVAWMFSASDQTTFPDRNMRYNFLDPGTGEWNWTGPDFMQSGVDVFTDYSGYGNLALVENQAVLSSHLGDPRRPVLALDAAQGGGIFEFCDGAPTMDGYSWPCIATSGETPVQCACLDYDGSRLFHSAVRTWCSWDSAQGIPGGQPEPGFPTHNVASSRDGLRVVATWVYADNLPGPGFYRESTDGGVTWQDPEELTWPSAFGPDTLASFYVGGLYPMYDIAGRLHVAAVVSPVVEGEVLPGIAEVWHWCPGNEPRWAEVHRAELGVSIIPPHQTEGPVARHPSLAEDGRGGLCVFWAQLDSVNWDPVSDVYRADILAAGDNDDNGASWCPAQRLTVPDSSSKCFPSAGDLGTGDTTAVCYVIDRVAGSSLYRQEWVTYNPVVVQHIPVGVLAVGEERLKPVLMEERRGRDQTICRAPELTRPGSWVIDIQGRDVTNRREYLAPGIYFLLSASGVERPATGVTKVIIQH